MSKKSLDEKNNDYISYKSSKIVFCKDGRILLTDKDDEIVDLRDCENCKQKDQRIAELEKQLAIRDKALEWACIKIEDLRCENADIADYEYNEIKTETRKKLLFEQAEEALKQLEGK